MLRVLPLLMRADRGLVSRTRSVGLLLAARHLARDPGLLRRAAAPAGADAEPVGVHGVAGTDARQSPVRPEAITRSAPTCAWTSWGKGVPEDACTRHLGQADKVAATNEEDRRWLFLPVTEHLKVPGIEAAARVGPLSGHGAS